MKNQYLIAFVVLRWVARIVGSLTALFLMFMLLIYTFGAEKSTPRTLIYVTIALFTLGVGLSWKWEMLGGLLLLASSVLFFAFNPYVIWPPSIYHVMPLVAFLVLPCSYRLRYMQRVKSEDR